MNRRILASAAALIMVLGASVCPVISAVDSFSITASADVSKNDGHFNYQVIHGGKSIQILGPVKKNPKIVNIPPEIDGLPVTEIAKDAFYNKDHKETNNLEKVTIPDTVEIIGDGAFSHNGALTSITIPSSVKTIGVSAFEGCKGLAKVELNEGLESIGDKAFYGCVKLPSFTIPASVKSIGSDISYACGTKDKDKANFLFYCYANTLGESYAFDKRIAYELIDPENSEKPVDNGIYNKQLRYRIINNYKEIRIVDARLAFGEITVPEKIGDLPVTEIGEAAFYNPEHEEKNELKKVTLPDTLTCIGNSAFACNEELTKINIPKGVKEIGDKAFEVCTKLEKIELPEGLETIGSNAFISCKSLTVVTIPATVKSVGSKAFANCGTITGSENFFIYCTEGTAGEKYAIDNNVEHESKPVAFKRGDVNGDNKVNISDVTTAALHVKNIKSIDLKALACADVNNDSLVSITDIAMMAAHVKGIKAL